MSPGPGGPLDASFPSPTVGPLVMSHWPPTSNPPSPPVITVSCAPTKIDLVHQRSPTAAKYTDVSALGAVMAFLYSSYIVMNAILSAVLGKVIDADWEAHANIKRSLSRVGG